MNVREPPFDNVLLRYALNMATDKKAIVESLEAGQSPALGCVPPMKGYEPVTSLPVIVDGVSFDVLRYDPEAARVPFPGGFGPGGKRLSFDADFRRQPLVHEIFSSSGARISTWM